jgi:hypothetical protein
MAPPRLSRTCFRSCAVFVALFGVSSGAFAQVAAAQASVSPSEGAAGATADPAVSAGTQREVQTELEATFWKADDLFQQGAYVEAAELFTKALELSHRPEIGDTGRQYSPHIAFNIAHSYRHARNCEAARMAFAHYRGLVDALPVEHVEWYDALLVECPGLANENAVGSAPTNSRDEALAGVTPSEPSPAGTWLLDVNTKSATPHEDSPTDMNRVVGFSAAGAAVLSLGLAGVFWVSAENQQELADVKKLWAEAEGYQSAANTRHVVAGVLTGLGVALGGTSVYLLTRPNENEQTARSAVAALALRVDGTNIRVWGQF